MKIAKVWRVFHLRASSEKILRWLVWDLGGNTWHLNCKSSTLGVKCNHHQMELLWPLESGHWRMLTSLTFNPLQTCRRKGMSGRQRGDSHAYRDFSYYHGRRMELDEAVGLIQPIASYLWALIGWRGAKNDFWRWRLWFFGLCKREIIWMICLINFFLSINFRKFVDHEW